MTIVIFFKTRSPIEPVTFVEKLCQDIEAGIPLQNCRYVKRLTPITAIDKATIKGLENVARKVIAPHFHGSDREAKKVSPSVPIDSSINADAIMQGLKLKDGCYD